MNQFSRFIDELSVKKKEQLELYFKQTDGMISFDEALLLYFLALRVTDGCIVEVGSYRGRSAVFLAHGVVDGASNKVPVYAVDPHKDFIGVLGGIFGAKDRTEFYKCMLENDCSDVVSLINLSSEMFASNWKEDVSLLWIDGDHSYEGVKKDFLCWQPNLTRNAVVAFDDSLDESLGPRKLITELVQQNKYKEILQVGKVTVLTASVEAAYA